MAAGLKEGLLCAMATLAPLRQSPRTRGVGAETFAAGKLCAAMASEPLRRLPSSTAASGKPKLRNCTLSLVEHERNKFCFTLCATAEAFALLSSRRESLRTTPPLGEQCKHSIALRPDCIAITSDQRTHSCAAEPRKSGTICDRWSRGRAVPPVPGARPCEHPRSSSFR